MIQISKYHAILTICKDSIDFYYKYTYNKYVSILINLQKEVLLMEFSFMLKIHTLKENVWNYYANIENWYIWEENLLNITLLGDFKTGNQGTMELKGMPPMDYTLDFVEPYKSFWDKTATPFGEIYFGHEIFEIADDCVQIKHTVKLDCDENDKANINFLKQVFSDVPDSMLLLKGVLETDD